MKKTNYFKIAITVMLLAAMAMLAFTGCGSKNSTAQAAANNPNGSTGSSAAAANNSGGNTGTPNNTAPNAEERKTQLQDSLQSLIKDGTITQEQADKIVETYTSNTVRFNGQGRQNNQSGNQQNAQQNGQPNNQQNNQQGNGQDRTRFNPLSKLVDDGTITQAQADAVMQKIRDSMPRRTNNQTSGS